jgi:hypothetical protein
MRNPFKRLLAQAGRDVIVRTIRPVSWRQSDRDSLRHFLLSPTGRKLVDIYKDTIATDLLPEHGAAFDPAEIRGRVQAKGETLRFLAVHANWPINSILADLPPDEEMAPASPMSASPMDLPEQQSGSDEAAVRQLEQDAERVPIPFDDE